MKLKEAAELALRRLERLDAEETGPCPAMEALRSALASSPTDGEVEAEPTAANLKPLVKSWALDTLVTEAGLAIAALEKGRDACILGCFDKPAQELDFRARELREALAPFRKEPKP